MIKKYILKINNIAVSVDGTLNVKSKKKALCIKDKTLLQY